MIYWNEAGRNPANANANTGMQNGQGGAGNRANRPDNIDQVIIARNTPRVTAGNDAFVVRPMTSDLTGPDAGYTYTDASQVSPMASSQNVELERHHDLRSTGVAYNSRYAIRTASPV